MSRRKPKEEWVENLPEEFWEENKGVPDYLLIKKIPELSTLNILRRIRKGLGKRNSLDIFESRFNSKYGEGACSRLKQMFEDPLIALSNIGEYFGFTRQAASLYFKKIYGKTYSNCQPNRVDTKIPYKRNVSGRVYKIYLKAQRILRKHGFKSAIVTWKSSYRLILDNSIKVAARRLYFMRPLGKESIYRFWATTKGNADVDFFLCFNTKGDIYIIPNNIMPGGLSIPPYGREGKYLTYKDNWDLLR